MKPLSFAALLVAALLPPITDALAEDAPDHVFKTDLIAFPDPWSMLLGRSGMVLVSDKQLVDIASDSEKKVNISLSATPRLVSLREMCERAQQRGHRTLAIAFDYFFAQYRKDARGLERKLWPDTDRYVELIGKISQTTRKYGLGIELSVLSPLEIGRGYREQTGESGRWMHYREGLRDKRSGAYSVQLWRQLSWTNNKGTIPVKDAGVRVFAFREKRVGGTPYYAVDPDEIVEITDTAEIEVFEGIRTGRDEVGKAEGKPTALAGYSSVRVRVHGEGRADIGPFDRVLVVQMYTTPEMDYFSDSARPFLHGLIDKYVAAGVHFNAIYADETHIQGDWTYFDHHDHGEFAVRYVSPGFERAFAARYGKQYADFAKWLVYFTRGQHDSSNDLAATSGAMHVFGTSPRDIHRTALLRARYYEFLQNSVVDLFVDAKEHLERSMGHPIHSRAHATWAESPTIDAYNSGGRNDYAEKYEYTSSFRWSNTVHQAASACYDYFKWGEFLHGTGNDTAECGWLDRNYWGFAIASSLGPLNRVRNAYAAHWGMPEELRVRRSALQDAWGTSPSLAFGLVTELYHRQVDVLMLYPLDLVAVDERFGSWVTQYAYANWIPQGMLVERGDVTDSGDVVIGDQSWVRFYGTVVATFEPFPRPELLALLEKVAQRGGRVIWSGPPPLLTKDGTDARERWQRLTGVRFRPEVHQGWHAAGRRVTFSGALGDVEPMTILTDLLPDRIYPVECEEGTEVIARARGKIVGTRRRLESGGTVTFLGFRPRDDQSRSMGYDERHWFDILSALGAYPPTGLMGGRNDNTEYVARSAEYFTARFPTGAVSIAPHLRDVEECWAGGFRRNRAQDVEAIKNLDLPPRRLKLEGFHVHGFAVDYSGDGAVAFLHERTGPLVAFAGRGCESITIDGVETVFADSELPLVAWAPVPEDRRVEGGAVMLVRAAGNGELRIPVASITALAVWREGPTPGSRGARVDSRVEDGRLIFRSTGGAATYYVVPAP